jgi:type I restriction enzyme S subunit
MSDFPESWLEVSLGEITADCEQRIPSPSDRFAYIDIGSISRETKTICSAQEISGAVAPSRARKLVRAGDTLVSMTRPNLNAVALVDMKYDGQIASTGFDVLRPIIVDPRWIYYLVRSNRFVDSMSNLVQGALYPAVRSKDVRSFVAPLAPVEEQKRIADKLERLLTRVDSCRERLERVPVILRRFRQSVLAAAISGKLTEEWRGTSHISASWKNTTLNDVASDFSYGTSAKSSKTGRMPVLRMGNIQDGILDWNELVYSTDETEIKKYKLEAGDVLFNRTNSPELVGKTAVYRGERSAIYAGYLIRVRCTDQLNPDYLNYCLNSPAGKDYCWKVKSDGVSQSNINAKKLAAFEFMLPPIQEQAEIVRRVELMFQFMDSLNTKLLNGKGKIDRLTPSVLAMAFRGELIASEVEVSGSKERGNEDARALLARITATKNEIEKSRKIRPRKADQPGSRNNTGKAKRMRKVDRETVLDAVIKLNQDQFTFDELRMSVDADYEQLKATWFNLLLEPNAPIRQIFDDARKAIVFKRVSK